MIVEDEAVIAMLVEDAVEAAGHSVVAQASNISDAMVTAAKADFDVALLDLNLNGQKAHGVAMVIESRGKRFAFVTGYGDDGVLAKFAHAPVLSKPFSFGDVAAILDKLAS
ncbi:response regulator [Sphingobium sp. DEHP117]|uniref:response regulator n=1 Tax=Sphingobium sp. DEHP117 TaxID=2993436 RepID=UPI0027D55902|nr:response regulator [Sphingobium sp. DEHP117]MDQ4419189.1 response regulator [Sphingobium sp. DEHP117]